MRLDPVQITGPAELPVSVERAKAHIRVDHDDEDALIQSLIGAATAHLDGYTGVLGRVLVEQTWREDFSWFSTTRIKLTLAPVSAVTAIQYYDSAGVLQTFAPEYYRLHSSGGTAFVTLVDGVSWPDTEVRDDAGQITYVAGYGAADKVPFDIKAAILLLCGHWYENREAVNVGNITSELPLAVAALIAPYRRIGI